jgi:hypothetical protein
MYNNICKEIRKATKNFLKNFKKCLTKCFLSFIIINVKRTENFNPRSKKFKKNKKPLDNEN